VPTLDTTPIPGLLVVTLDVHGDNRGWFKENWQRAKMTALGLPDFGPVQQNDSYNAARGVTRGVHAEPWDKFVSIATGLAYGAWVDLREGPSFGTTYTHELGPDTAVFVPRGVGNAYQVLEDATLYSYLVNAHWRPDAGYTEVNPADPALAIDWPIPLDDPSVELSQKDRNSPVLADVTPMAPAPVLVVGGSGQVGTALRRAFPAAHAPSRSELDLADPDSVARFDFSSYDVVLNAAAYTAVDAARPTAAARGRPTPPDRPCSRRRPRSTASRWCTSPPTTSSTARSRSTRRTNPCPHWGSTARARPPATSPWPPPPGTTCSARPGWSATATTSCAPCSGWPATASRPPWSPTRSAG
jgi:dTDP-4-dehydrorhamnose 3,5-epimerase